jgi:DNA repair exonuclease SbcCD nuclease subunit
MIVFTADLHLSPTIWADLPDVRGDSYRAFRQICDYCIQHKAEALVLGGDVFNRSTPDSMSVAFFRSCIVNVRESGTRVLGIQGQHDRSNPPWFSVVDGVEWLHDVTSTVLVDGKSCRISGLDNTDAASVQKWLQGCAVDPPDIIVMHQALRQVFPIEDAWDLDKEWIPEGPLVLLGDLHFEAQQGCCYYSGSTHIRSVSENPQKSFIVVHQEDGTLTVKRHPLKSREVLMATIGDEDGLKSALNLVEVVPSAELQPLLIARVAPSVKDAYVQLIEACRKRDIALKIRDLSAAAEAQPDVPSGEVANISLEQCLGSVVDREKQPELFAMLTRILTAAHAEEELAAIKSEMGVTK